MGSGMGQNTSSGMGVIKLCNGREQGRHPIKSKGFRDIASMEPAAFKDASKLRLPVLMTDPINVPVRRKARLPFPDEI